MKKQHTAQKGSLLIEMIAVIGLLALITPILFQQIQRRNEEIIDAQIATEMRMLKDGASAYIQANETQLAQLPSTNQLYPGCGMWNSETKTYVESALHQCGVDGSSEVISETIAPYLPGTASVSANDDYDVFFFGKTVPTKECSELESCTPEYRPVIYAVIVQNTDSSMGNLRRAAKVASLIGLEGGVVDSACENGTCRVSGMQGMWSATIPTGTGGPKQYSVAVISSFDEAVSSNILKDVRWQHLQSETAQADTVAANYLGTREIFVVDKSDDCITDFGNNTITVKGSKNADGSVSTCTPFFEVNPTTKEVHVAGVITSDPTPAGSACESLNTELACEASAANGCVWSEGACKGRYQVDPAYTSVMNDIKLTSRGGARLSDVLPTWILKDVYYKPFGSGTCCFGPDCSSDDNNACRVVLPTCPAGYNVAITVTPSTTQQGYAQTNEDTEHAYTTTPTGLINGAEKPIGISGAVRYVINGTTEGWLPPETPISSVDITVETWMLPDGKWEEVPASGFTDFSLLIHTYCVWMETATPDKNRPVPATP